MDRADPPTTLPIHRRRPSAVSTRFPRGPSPSPTAQCPCRVPINPLSGASHPEGFGLGLGGKARVRDRKVGVSLGGIGRLRDRNHDGPPAIFHLLGSRAMEQRHRRARLALDHPVASHVEQFRGNRNSHRPPDADQRPFLRIRASSRPDGSLSARGDSCSSRWLTEASGGRRTGSRSSPRVGCGELVRAPGIHSTSWRMFSSHLAADPYDGGHVVHGARLELALDVAVDDPSRPSVASGHADLDAPSRSRGAAARRGSPPARDPPPPGARSAAAPHSGGGSRGARRPGACASGRASG